MEEGMTREQVGQLLNNLADHGTVDDETYQTLKAHDAALRAALEQSEEMNKGLAAGQCEDPIAGEYGHMLCGRVLELERRLAQAQARIAELEGRGEGSWRPHP